MNTLQRTVESLPHADRAAVAAGGPAAVALLKRALISLLAALIAFYITAWLLPGQLQVASLLGGLAAVLIIAALNLLVRPDPHRPGGQPLGRGPRPAHAALPGLRLLAARSARPGRDRHGGPHRPAGRLLRLRLPAGRHLGALRPGRGRLLLRHPGAHAGQPAAGHHADRRARPRHHPARRALPRRHEPRRCAPVGCRTMASWIRDGSHRLGHWDALLPSTTPASQAGILHGNNDGIPNFRWWEKKARRLLVANHPEDATVIEQRISNGEGLLSPGGASISNIFTGDADRAFLVMSTIKVKERGLGQSDAFAWFFVSPYNYLVMGAKYLAEVVKENIQSRRQARAGIVPFMGHHRGFPYPVRPCRHERRAAGPGHLAHHPGDVPRHAGHLHGLHRLRRDRPPQRTRAARVARRPRRRGPRAAHAQEGGRGRRASLSLRHPRRPRPEPRPDLPAALRRDPPGRRPLAHGRRGLRRGRHGPDRGLGPAEHVPRRGLRDQGRERLAGPRRSRTTARAASRWSSARTRRSTRPPARATGARPRSRARKRRRRRPRSPTWSWSRAATWPSSTSTSATSA